jgi:hypothetical protein
MTDLMTLDENLFNHLKSLQSLIISENKFLQKIPRDLFRNNKQLWSVDLSYNNLTFIDAVFPQSATIIQLYNNPCIDAFFNNSDDANNAMKEKCSDGVEENIPGDYEKFEDLHLDILNLEARVGDLETTFEEETLAINSKIKYLEILNLNSTESFKRINEKLLNETAEKSKQLNALHDYIQKLENSLKSLMNKDEISFEYLRAENDEILEKVDKNRFLIMILFFIIVILFLICLSLILTLKYNRKFYRSEMYLMKEDN